MVVLIIISFFHLTQVDQCLALFFMLVLIVCFAIIASLALESKMSTVNLYFVLHIFVPIMAFQRHDGGP